MPTPAVTAYVGLGANLGDPVRAVSDALRALERIPDTELSRRSSLYRSDPVGLAAQPSFINAVAELRTALPARRLLQELLGVETLAGRRRSFPNAPRTLDLDLLLYDDQQIDEPGLCVPHPRMHERRFVLEPLVEIAPDCRIPGDGLASERLAEVLDQGVTRLQDAVP